MSAFNYPLLSYSLTRDSCQRELERECLKHPNNDELQIALRVLAETKRADLREPSNADVDRELWEKVLTVTKDVAKAKDASPADYALPNGWFKDELKKSFSDSEYASKLQERREAEGREIMPRLWGYSIFAIFVALAGAFCLFKLLAIGGVFKPGLATESGAQFTGRKLLAITLTAFYCSLVYGVAILILQSAFPVLLPPLRTSALTNAGTDVVLLFVIVLCAQLWIMKPSKANLIDVLKLRMKRSELSVRFKQAMVAYAITCFFVTTIVLIQANCFGLMETSNRIVLDIEMLTVDRDIFALALYGVMTVILAPLLEEIFFRGLIYRWLRGLFDVVPSCIISAALFALCHFDPMQLPFLLTAGVVFAMTYEKTKSLVPSMIAHALSNLTFFVGVFLAQ
jgi:membrane protease YdiL (CAAX protease family)